MSDRLNAVALVDGKPQLELTAQEWIFPFRQADENRPAYFHMSPYRSEELKRWYDKLIIRRRQRGTSERVIEIPDVPEVADFFDKHYLRMSNVELEDGSEPTQEKVREWLAAADDIKLAMFRQCYDAVRPEAVQNGNGRKSLKAVLLFSKPEHTVDTQMKLFSPDSGQEEKVTVKHVMGKLAPNDAHRYDRSISIIENTRSNEQYVEANWDVVENLYNQAAFGLEGALLNGKPCTRENKNDWADLVPFPMKVYVMGALNSEAKLKNA